MGSRIVLPTAIVSSRPSSDSIQVGGDLVQVQFAPISLASSGISTLVSGVAGHQIRVISYLLVASASVIFTWYSNPTGAISGPLPVGASTVVPCGFNPMGWVQTAVGDDLAVNLSGNVSVGGHFQYIIV